MKVLCRPQLESRKRAGLHRTYTWTGNNARNETRTGQRMKASLKTLVTAFAAVAGRCRPAGADRRRWRNHYGRRRERHDGRRHLERHGRLGRHRHVGHGLRHAVADRQPRRHASVAAAAHRAPAGHEDLVSDPTRPTSPPLTPSRPCTISGPRTGTTCRASTSSTRAAPTGLSPGSGMWGGWQMGDMMNGGSWNPRPHVGHGLRRFLDDEPSRRHRVSGSRYAAGRSAP